MRIFPAPHTRTRCTHTHTVLAGRDGIPGGLLERRRLFCACCLFCLCQRSLSVPVYDSGAACGFVERRWRQLRWNILYSSVALYVNTAGYAVCLLPATCLPRHTLLFFVLLCYVGDRRFAFARCGVNAGLACLVASMRCGCCTAHRAAPGILPVLAYMRWVPLWLSVPRSPRTFWRIVCCSSAGW